MTQTAKLAVIGSGSWGSTLGAMLWENGHDVRLWSPTEEEAAALRKNGHPPGVPELKLPDLKITTSMAEALENAEAVILVIPAQKTAEVCGRIRQAGAPRLAIIASKGIDLETLRPLSDVVEESLPQTTVGVVSGPCIAREVAQRIPTSVVAACRDEALAEKIQHWFHSPFFRVYRQSDVLGVEFGGAYKNVIAIAAGVGDGLGFGANSKSALLTRGLAEMRRFVVAMGGEELTVAGLAGLGDLCVTCFSPHSRNRRFGEAVGRKKDAESAIREIGETVEGVLTAQAVFRMAKEKGLQVPVAEAVVHLVDGSWQPKDAVEKLMSRELKEEFQ